MEGVKISYQVIDKYLKNNRSGQLLNPEGIVIHSTDNPGATAIDHFNYFDSAYRGVSGHYFVDWNEIIKAVPENEVAWHAGRTANNKYLAVEMCEPKDHDPQKFEEVWKRTVWLIADICVRYGWDVSSSVLSHREVSLRWNESTHIDPYPFFEKYNRTWDQLIEDIVREIERINEGGEPPNQNIESNKNIFSAFKKIFFFGE